VLADMMMPMMDGAAVIRVLMQLQPGNENHCHKRADRQAGRSRGGRRRGKVFSPEALPLEMLQVRFASCSTPPPTKTTNLRA
jgi:hypothetical protein